MKQYGKKTFKLGNKKITFIKQKRLSIAKALSSHRKYKVNQTSFDLLLNEYRTPYRLYFQ